ncbi:alpha/beta hydrolase [Donghicola sp. XS_ASV15]|uniref:alpha/beta hydrolase n=1 Tax=Donghicola sp. XS_ASV15 TaxID=3241295 RepID=UPI003511958D
MRTDGVISRYHALLNEPHSMPLAHRGFIVGIEKAPRALIGYSEKTPENDTLLRKPWRTPEGAGPKDLENQQQTFDRALSDPKLMFVSHILQYGPDPRGNGHSVRQLHNSYSGSALTPVKQPHSAPSKLPQNLYAEGWAAMDRLEQAIDQEIRQATQDKRPFTHVLFVSMGWNNDQIEALERYNAIIQTTRNAAGGSENFDPLVIGITWPSVWGGTSVLDIANRALHIGSYAAKSVDADEIGYSYANHILNGILARIENRHGIGTVAIGHSMGARIVTRAYYSADMLRDAPARTGQGPLVIGLQGAFSANRFRPGYELVPVVRWLFSGEGAPYQDHSAPRGDVVLTWSTHDRANPIARFATGARHVGGKAGHTTIQDTPALKEKFEPFTWPYDGLGDSYCPKEQQKTKVAYIDASEIIRSHGDIRNPQVGKLIWQTIACYRG